LRVPAVAAIAVALLVALSGGTSAQLIFKTPTPAPQPPTPTPTLTPPPTSTPAPTDEPIPSELPIPGNSPKPDDEKKDETKDGGKVDVPGDVDDKLEDKLPEGLEELVVPVLPRTRARNTANLVRVLQPLADLGYPLEQVLVEGMGRFPVAGLAYYSDDWLNPRYTPKPHLHHGLDIFADFGTPIRSPDRGVVTRLTDGVAGGISVWVRGQDGTHYYFAHLLERAEGIHVGQSVQVGTVLGFVGDTGNASGGRPHLHFEIHPGGGAAVPPKPSVDEWLDEAEEIAPRWVEAKKSELRARGDAGGAPTLVVEKKEEIETSMLLTLLDPVGGSVGMLPSLELQPRRGRSVSEQLVAQLIRQRVRGLLFVPSSGLDLY
jgi:murein DD-endopeptidase MepM/ murein hydrolase activator NlpD